MFSLVITDSAGKVLYRNLRKASDGVYDFESGFGFIDPLDIQRYSWKVVDTAC